MYTIFYVNTRFYNKTTRPYNDSSQAMGAKIIYSSATRQRFKHGITTNAIDL